MKLYAVFQAEKLGERGIGLKYAHGWGGANTIFSIKEEAEDWLRNLIIQIKHEQGIGIRTANNLNPKESLDFYIGEVELSITEKSLQQMKERGWKFEEAEKFFEKVMLDENGEEKDSLKRIQENMDVYFGHKAATSDKNEQEKLNSI